MPYIKRLTSIVAFVIAVAQSVSYLWGNQHFNSMLFEEAKEKDGLVGRLAFPMARTSLEQSIGNNVTAAQVFNACQVTSYIDVYKLRDDEWIMETFDEFGNEKRKGGDEFYVTLGKSAAVALVEDLRNGKYRMEFQAPPMKSLHADADIPNLLHVTLQYSCGVGFMAPNRKQNWRAGGSITESASLVLTTPPVIKDFIPPQWPDLSKYDQIIALGDSMMAHLARKHPNITMGQKLKRPLREETVEYFLNALHLMHDTSIRRTGSQTALLLGSALYDILESEHFESEPFSSHLEGCRKLITAIKQEYPNVDIIWKSPSAVHIHRVTDSCSDACRERVKYMSSSRAMLLHQEQKKLMRDLNVQFMDVYNAYYLSADHTMAGDGRHYSDDLGITIMGWFTST